MAAPHDEDGFEGEFHEKDRKLDADLKGKLDFFLWHQRFKGGYQSWSRARNDAKPSLLLSGNALAVAENWLLLHPAKFSDGERRFIMRSLAQTTQAAIGVETSTKNTQSRTRSRVAIPLMAAGLVVAAIALPRMAAKQPTQLPPPEQTADAPQDGHAERHRVAAAADLESRNRDTSNDKSTVREQDSAGEGRSTDGPRTGKPDARPQTMDRHRQHKTAEQIRKLAGMAGERFEAADMQTGHKITLEALRRVVAMPAGSARDNAVLAAASAAHQGLAQRISLDGRPAEAPAVPGVIFCEGADAVILATADRDIRTFRLPVIRDRSLPAVRPGSAKGPAVAADPHLLEGAAADPSCSRLILPRADDSVEIYATRTGQRIARFEGHESDPTVAALSPNGALAASGSTDTTVRLWDARSGRSRLVLSGHGGRINALAFDAAGGRIASGSSDRTVRIWDTASGVLLAILKGQQGPVKGLAFSPDGTTLIAWGDGAVYAHDLSHPVRVATLRAPSRTLLSAVHAPVGRRVLAIADDGTAVVFDAATGMPLFELTRPPGDVRSAAWSRDGQSLFSVGWTGDITLHDAETGQAYATAAVFDGRAAGAGFSADGSTVFALSQAGDLLIVPLLQSIAVAVETVKSAAGGCLGTTEANDLNAGPAAGDCDIIPETAEGERPWLIAAAPKRPAQRTPLPDIDLAASAIASAQE